MIISHQEYINIYYVFIFIIIILVQIKYYNRPIQNNKIWTFLVFLFVLWHITFRDPFIDDGGDTIRYSYSFLLFSASDISIIQNLRDPVFQSFTYILSKSVNLTTYYAIMAFLYLYPIIYSFKKTFPNNYFMAFIMYVSAFSFWAYGTNAMRHGIAASFAIAGFLLSSNKKKILFFLCSVAFHKSMIIPIFFYFLTLYIKTNKFYISLWILSIPINFTIGTKVMSIISLYDTRFAGYIRDPDYVAEHFSYVGFRWDFLLYSLCPIGGRKCYGADCNCFV